MKVTSARKIAVDAAKQAFTSINGLICIKITTESRNSLVVVGACARAARATLGRRRQVSPHARFDLWVCTHPTISCYLTHTQPPCNYQLMYHSQGKQHRHNIYIGVSRYYIIKGNKATVNESYPGPDPESHL